MALLTSLAAPQFQRVFPRFELASAGRGLQEDLRSLRNRAIHFNKETFLELDVESGLYRLGPEGAERSLPEGIRLTLVAARSEQIDPDVARIRFFPDGSSTGGRITLERDNARMTIAVDWFDGRALEVDEET